MGKGAGMVVGIFFFWIQVTYHSQVSGRLSVINIPQYFLGRGSM